MADELTPSNELFQVDGLTLPISEKSHAVISSDLGVLCLEIWAELTPALRQRSDLWSGFDSQQQVGFRFHGSGLHRDGVPHGTFRFEDGTSESFKAYMWDDGWEFSLVFTGEVRLENGWATWEGTLGASWSDRPGLPILIRKAIAFEDLDWSGYRFSSLEETEGVAEETVRRLDLTGVDFSRLPDRLLAFRNLEQLAITWTSEGWGESELLPLASLGPEIGQLASLTSLQLTGTSLTELPGEIGSLSRLERLWVNRGQLSSTPDSLWRLPALQFLVLEHNQLNALPEAIDLPCLRSLDLSHNGFTTLPASLALQPKLQRLDLQDNPLDGLPTQFNGVPKLELSIEDKLRLLDFTYAGAGGQGTVEWDDTPFFVGDDLALWGALRPGLGKIGGAPLIEAARRVARRGLRLLHQEPDTYGALGNTRFGGWPDLPQGWEYPRFQFPDQEDPERRYAYEFLAQLDLAALAPLQDYLPRHGYLYFFLGTIHEMNPLVLYYEGGKEGLVSGHDIALGEDDFFEFSEPPYAAFGVSAQPYASMPSTYAASSNPWLFTPEVEALIDHSEEVWKLEQELSSEVDSRAHEINSHVFTQHESPELQAALALKGRPQDWTVLLKVNSVGDFQWWDAGDLFFVIHKSDLAKGDFSNVYCGLESS